MHPGTIYLLQILKNSYEEDQIGYRQTFFALSIP